MITTGTRVYYTGDMANKEGHGVIVTGLDSYTDIRLDDGRTFKRIPRCGIGEEYKGTGDPRFVTEAAYQLWRDRQWQLLAAFAAKMKIK